MGKHKLIEKLTSDAMMENMCYCRGGLKGLNRNVINDSKSTKPGYRIQQLSEEDRELLKTATSDDFKWRGFK